MKGRYEFLEGYICVHELYGTMRHLRVLYKRQVTNYLRGWRFENAKLYVQYWGNISLRFSSYSKAFTSELLENLKEMFPCYW